MTNEVRFIDTTVRDGNQSLWALNMRVGAMLDAIGAFGLATPTGACPDVGIAGLTLAACGESHFVDPIPRRVSAANRPIERKVDRQRAKTLRTTASVLNDPIPRR